MDYLTFRGHMHSALLMLFVLLGLNLSVSAQILPKPAPILNVDQPKYKGAFEKPLPTKQYMIDFMEVYVHMYIKQFYQLNDIEDQIFNEKKLIEQFREDIEGIPLNFILAVAEGSVHFLRTQLDAIAYENSPKSTSMMLNDSVKEVDRRVAELEREMALVKEFFRVTDIKAGDNPQPKIDFIGELAKIKKEISTVSGQIKKQAQVQSNYQVYSRPAEDSGETQSKSTYWIAIAALTISMVSFFANTKSKTKK